MTEPFMPFESSTAYYIHRLLNDSEDESESEYLPGMQGLMPYLHCSRTPCTFSWRDIDVHAYSWLVKYKLIDRAANEPCRTSKRGLRLLWMLCGAKENFRRILYETVPTEVADEAEETRRCNQTMEDRVWESSRSPSGPPTSQT